jgi:hypothetical protein
MEMRIPFINNTFQQKKTRMLPQDLIKTPAKHGWECRRISNVHCSKGNPGKAGSEACSKPHELIPNLINVEFQKCLKKQCGLNLNMLKNVYYSFSNIESSSELSC